MFSGDCRKHRVLPAPPLDPRTKMRVDSAGSINAPIPARSGVQYPYMARCWNMPTLSAVVHADPATASCGNINDNAATIRHRYGTSARVVEPSLAYRRNDDSAAAHINAAFAAVTPYG